MPPKPSAGLVLYRTPASGLEVLLVHPGGPFWVHKDAGAWSIPKGELDPEEEPLPAARREFAEELGSAAPSGEVIDLGEIRQRSGKRVRAFAIAGDFDPATVRSNLIEIEWPPRSGRRLQVPEVDRAGWFDLAGAREALNPAQFELIDRLTSTLRGSVV
jgi:predicted NUDIX family NTP pyrophosphohydrolase